MLIYSVRADGLEAEIFADSAQKAAEEHVYTNMQVEPPENETTWIVTQVHELGKDDEEDRVKVAIDPDEPDCNFGRDEHDWISPQSLVGGLDENPGVFGHGGGVRIHSVCRFCGTERIKDTWAQDPEDGEQGLDSIEYVEAKYSKEVEPDYKYEVLPSIQDGKALIGVDAYQFGYHVTGATFIVDSDGDAEVDTQSDGYKPNPFHEDGCWPEPAEIFIADALELIESR